MLRLDDEAIAGRVARRAVAGATNAVEEATRTAAEAKNIWVEVFMVIQVDQYGSLLALLGAIKRGISWDRFTCKEGALVGRG